MKAGKTMGDRAKSSNAIPSNVSFKDKMLIGFGKQMQDKDSKFYNTEMEQRVAANVASIMSRYVVDYSSGMARPKFVNQKGAAVHNKLMKKKSVVAY